MPGKADRASANLADLRGRIIELVVQNALAMVQCAIDGVKEEGQYQAIKYLFEMIGLYPATAGAEDGVGNSLAQILLQRLGLEEEAHPARHSNVNLEVTSSRKIGVRA